MATAVRSTSRVIKAVVALPCSMSGDHGPPACSVARNRSFSGTKMAVIAGSLNEAPLLRSRTGFHNNPGGYVVSHALRALVLPRFGLFSRAPFRKDAPMSTLKPLQIDIVSDVVCPWCYIGKRRIENALALARRGAGGDSLAAVLPQSVGAARGHQPRRISHREIRLGRGLQGHRGPRRRRGGAKRGCCTGPTSSSASPTPPIATA